MECPQCHADVSPDAVECRACGAELTELVEGARVRTDAGNPPAAAQRSRRVLLVTVCVLALIVAGVAAALVLRDGGDEASSDSPSQAQTEPGSVETPASDDSSATAPKAETPTVGDTPNGTASEEPPGPLGYATAEAAARAALEASGSGEYVLAPAREGAELTVYWAGPPQSEWVYEMIVQRLADGSWSVVSMTNIWEEYEVP